MTVAPSGVLTTLILSVAAMAMTHLCLPMDASWIDTTASIEDVSIEIKSHYIHRITLHNNNHSIISCPPFLITSEYTRVDGNRCMLSELIDT